MAGFGAQTANNISLFLVFIETESREQATRFFVKTVPTLKEERLRLRAIAIAVERCAARRLSVEATIFV
jgi:hypothetical protein